MHYQKLTLFSDDALPQDDLDILFSHLQQLSPPPSLIEHILNWFSSYQPSDPSFFHSILKDDIASLLMLNEKQKSCWCEE